MSALPTIIPISDLRRNASAIIKQASATGDPVFITQHGRACAVLMSVGAYERMQRQIEILRILARGSAEAVAGLGHDAEDVMAEARALLESE